MSYEIDVQLMPKDRAAWMGEIARRVANLGEAPSKIVVGKFSRPFAQWPAYWVIAKPNLEMDWPPS